MSFETCGAPTGTHGRDECPMGNPCPFHGPKRQAAELEQLNFWAKDRMEDKANKTHKADWEKVFTKRPPEEEELERKALHPNNTDADPVNHPPHYKTGGFEVIDIIEAFGLGFRLGNAVKYILRAGKKGDYKEDLRKAIWYLQREVEKS